jgi:hypothetical protein
MLLRSQERYTRIKILLIHSLQIWNYFYVFLLIWCADVKNNFKNNKNIVLIYFLKKYYKKQLLLNFQTPINNWFLESLLNIFLVFLIVMF